MTTEEKAKAYDEALNVALETYQTQPMYKNWLEKMFPELKESEDERIRKECISIIKAWEQLCRKEGDVCKVAPDCLAWLEKQGEHSNFLSKIQVGDKVTRNEDGVLVNLSQLNRVAKKQGEQILANSAKTCNGGQNTDVVIPKFRVGDVIHLKDSCIEYTIKSISDGHYYGNGFSFNIVGCDRDYELVEQKPADKIESKFKEGEWIITNKNHIWYVDETPETTSYLYRLINQYGKVEVAEFEVVDKKARLWTIQDANDGDVLVASDGSIFLFKGTIDCACKHYVALSTDGAVKFNEGLEHFWETSTAVHPATKEQRDLLFQKLKEAGYEWDAEHKQLNKIEQKSTTMSLDEAIEHCKEKSCGNNACALEHKQLEKWLTELKELKEQNPWSEEDEKIINKLIAVVELYYGIGNDLDKQRCLSWLNSLIDKYTWKPTKEQLTELRCVISGCSYDIEPLVELENELKAL